MSERTHDQILADLYVISWELDTMSRRIDRLVDEIDPRWRKRRERERAKVGEFPL